MDAGGLESNVIYRDVNPEIVNITLETSPSGIDLLLDGQTVQTPYIFASVVGITRSIEAPSQTHVSPDEYYFQEWSNVSSNEAYTFNTPDVNTTYEAEYSTTQTSVIKASSGEIKLFPSPASESLTVSISSFQEGNISILDLAGKTIYQMNMKESSITIPVAGLKKGLYLVRIENKEGITIKSFVKE